MTIEGGTTVEQLVAEANAEVECVSAEALQAELDDPDLVLIDLRDVRELEREGWLPGAKHMPRGMIEFWVDPKSPYARPIFEEDKRFVFYCQSGWRSALACQAAQRLGLRRAAHLESGFRGWQAAGGEVVPYARRSKGI